MSCNSPKRVLGCLPILLLILLVNAIVLPLTQAAPGNVPEEVTILHSSANAEAQRFGEILSLIEQKYFEPVRMPDLVYHAIEGMVEGREETGVTLEGDLSELRISSAQYSTTLSMDPNPRSWERYQDIFGKALTFLKIYPLNGDEALTSELAKLGIDHMLSKMDPHTDYLTPDEFEEVESETSGEYGGVGIEITLKQGELTVVSTFEGSPANVAGIQSGDHIVGVAGEPTSKMTLFDAVRRIRGREGTSIVLSIMREGLTAPREYALRREIIHILSVAYRSLGDKIGYIKIRTFNKSTDEDLEAALVELESHGHKGVILDLRGNPGGLLEEAIDVAGRFLHKGQLVVETWSHVPDQNIKFVNRHGKGRGDQPLLVLLDRGSASASEIVGSALHDHKRALIVGETTFGKGTVQTIIPLSDGSALRLTVAKFRSPLGREIDDVGVSPDVAVEMWSRSGSSGLSNPPSVEEDTSQSAAATPKAPLEIRVEDRDDLELLTVYDESGRPSDDLALAFAKTVLTRIEPEAMDEFIAHPASLRRLVMKEEKYVKTSPVGDQGAPSPAPVAGEK